MFAVGAIASNCRAFTGVALESCLAICIRSALLAFAIDAELTLGFTILVRFAGRIVRLASGKGNHGQDGQKRSAENISHRNPP